MLTSPSADADARDFAGGASPGLWQATVDTEGPGLYRLATKLTAFVSVGPPNPREYQEVLSSVSNLSPLAEATGGSVRRVATKPDDTPRVPSIVALSGASRFSGGDYIGIRITDSSVVRGVGVTPIFLGFIGLVLLAASLLAAWLGEARLGRANRSA